MLWQIKTAGSGYSMPAVVGEHLYLLGNEGMENEYVQALSVKDGKRIWSTRLGKVGNPDQQPAFAADRSTPTVEKEVLYALGSDGDLACLDLKDGKARWQKNLKTEFGGKAGVWAYSESPLIDGDKIICTPGGNDATIVALDKKTGNTIWKCSVPGGSEAAYASAIIVEADGVRQYVQLVQKGLVGVDAKTGKLLWHYGKPVSRFNANIPTPVAYKGYIYSAAAGTGGGVVKLKLNDGKADAEQVYFESKLPTAIGGSVEVGDFLYGTTAQALQCIEFTTGKVKWDDRAIGAAAICYAEGRLYLHGENGDVALVEATTEGYHEKGRFTPPDQPKRLSSMEKAWAYPVVANGRLYIRDQDRLWAYEIRTGPVRP